MDMITVTSPAKVIAALRTATPLLLTNELTAKIFDPIGQLFRTQFVRDFVRTNAQVVLSCKGTNKYYLRYCRDKKDNYVLFITLTTKGSLSTGGLL